MGVNFKYLMKANNIFWFPKSQITSMQYLRSKNGIAKKKDLPIRKDFSDIFQIIQFEI